MTIATSPLAGASISELEQKDGGKKRISSRTVRALADRRLTAEPR